MSNDSPVARGYERILNTIFFSILAAFAAAVVWFFFIIPAFMFTIAGGVLLVWAAYSFFTFLEVGNMLGHLSKYDRREYEKYSAKHPKTTKLLTWIGGGTKQ